MSLLEDVNAAVQEFGNTHWSEYADEVGGEVVESEVINQGRWCNYVRAVIGRGDEYVVVYAAEPATENQNWDDWGADFVSVEAATQTTVTKIVYVTE